MTRTEKIAKHVFDIANLIDADPVELLSEIADSILDDHREAQLAMDYIETLT